MSGERLFELLGGLDLELVDAASETPAARKRRWAALIAPLAAACIVLALLGPALMPAKNAMGGQEVNYNQSPAPEGAPGDGSQNPDWEGSSGNAADNGVTGSPETNETQNGGTDINGGRWIDGVVTEVGESIVVTSDSGERYVLTMSERAPVPERMPELEAGDAVRVVYGGELIWTDSGTAEVPVVVGIYTRAFPFRDLRAEDVASVTVGDRVLPDDEMARAIELLRGLVTVGEPITGWRENGWETVTFTLSLKDGETLTVELAERELLILDGATWDMDHWLPEVSELWELAARTAPEEPPGLDVVSDDTCFDTLQGAYSWEKVNPDGTSEVTVACSAHPLEGNKDLLLKFKFETTEQTAVLNFTQAPDRITEVICWSDEHWGDTDAAGENVELNGYEIELKPGGYIYDVEAEWDTVNGYGGTAHYSFYIDYMPVGGDPISQDAQE